MTNEENNVLLLMYLEMLEEKLKDTEEKEGE